MAPWRGLFRLIGIALLLALLKQAASGQVAVANAQESYCGDGVCEPGEPDTCREDCPPASTCGDGICSAFEDYQNCFLDCLPPSPTPTSTPTPTPTNIPPSPTTTVSLTAITVTDTPSPEPTLASATPTMHPTIMQVAGRATTEPTPTPVSACREAQIEEINEEIAAAFMTATEGNLTDRWVICDRPPTEMCLASSPDRSENQDILSLLDCHQTGECDVYNAVRFDDGRICLAEQSPDCSDGCAWAVVPSEQKLFGLPHPVLLGLMITSLMGSIMILHTVFPVPAGDEPGSSANAASH